jgi:hypothetical protein
VRAYIPNPAHGIDGVPGQRIDTPFEFRNFVTALAVAMSLGVIFTGFFSLPFFLVVI